MSDILSEILKLVALAASIVVPWLAQRGIAAFERRTHIAVTEQQRALVLGAAQRGAGIAYDALASYTYGTDPAKVREAAFKAGVDYLKIAAPEAIQALDIDSDTLENMVRGHLGALLAADPAVTVAPVLTAAGNGTVPAAKLWPDPPPIPAKPPAPATTPVL